MRTVLDSGVTVFLPDDEIEDEVREQLNEMGNHEAFDAESVRVMPDTHWGKGAAIGFTMPIQNRVVPNTIGVDIGCGMFCAYLDGSAHNWNDDEYAERVDREIRERIPMGRQVRSDPVMHIENEFPWDECRENLENLQDTIGFEETPDWFDGYGGEYFNELCERIGYDKGRAINSLGSLGGGNHFIEIGRRSDDGLAVTLHSGSRGIGLTIANYHQDRATEETFRRRNLIEIPESEAKYFEGKSLQNDGKEKYAKPGDLSIDREAVLEDYEGEAIEGKFGQLKSFLNAGKDDSHPLDYLEGEEAVGYYIDMIFAQKYASESRKAMIIDIADVLGMGITYRIESVHNYIDFEDGVIRKGATRAHKGEYAIIPYNMRDGTIIVRGKGNEDWNYSAPHGAGRVMSRRRAEDLFDEDELLEEMDGIATSVIPLDEAPGAYKEYSLIEDAIDPTAEIVDRLKPLQNLKADE